MKNALHPRDERGQMILLIALAMVAIVGVSALAIDGSFMYEKRNRLHAAADAAAKSAALEVKRGNTSGGNLLAFVQQEVVAHGLPTSTVEFVNCPPASGPYSGGTCGTTSSYVEVILREQTSTFFARVIGFTNMTPRARSVAGTAPGSGCLVTLNPTGTGLNMANNTTITAAGCDVAVNSGDTSDAMIMGNGTLINAHAVGVVGVPNLKGGAVVQPSLSQGIAHFTDPLAGVYPVPIGTSCSGVPPLNVAGIVSLPSTGPVTTVCGINFTNGSTLNIGAGVFLIDGGIAMNNNTTINATSGTMIYVMTGIVDMNNNNHINITAPTTGTYAGLAFWQGNPQTINLKNNSYWTVSGITYAPVGGGFRVGNNDYIDGLCAVFVVAQMEINNNTVLQSDCSIFGGNPLRTVSLAE